ncbi:MAG: DNA polymerase IV [Candidatus Dormibacteraeota bacterium]|nr:DNA polymerase IV [Candidatus Dormibacteraeota bacterium]
MARAGEATILHADLDAFYASVEQLLDPSLRGRPIAVGEGVVLAASYEARAFGIRAGMPGWTARRLCPDLRFVGGHFHKYQLLGDQVIDVLRDFTPLVERISVDEAFLDVAGTDHLFGSPSEIAAAIRQRVRREVGLAVSVGVARTKHLAKIASQAAKPDGLVTVEPGRELEFLHPLPVELMWGVGPVTLAQLTSVGIHTIGDLAATSDPVLSRMLGRAAGDKLGSLATNTDPRRIETTRRVASVGAQSALGRRRPTSRLLRSTLGYLADRVAGRLRAGGRAGRTITVRVRFTGLRSVTRSVTLPAAISASLTLTELATELADAALADHPAEREITLLAVSVSQLVEDSVLQLELPLCLGVDRRRPGTAAGSARSALDGAVDAIRDRFGRDAVGYATVVFSEVGRVPEEFRELAQR